MTPRTRWQLEASFKFDLLCLLNILTNDPFYTERYPGEYERFAPRMTPDVMEALTSIRRTIKEQKGGIVSALLTLLFSVTDDQALDDLIARLDNDEPMRQGYAASPYYSESSWAQYQSLRGELSCVFHWLKAIGFESEWHEAIRPKVEQRIAELIPEVARYDIIEAIERRLGRRLESDHVMVYLPYYVKPHGIKITGMRFLTAIDYPLRVVVHNAIHELLHPPYNLADDDELRVLIDRWREDPFVMHHVENHDPNFGYNSFEGYIEENMVQALDQLICEEFEVGHRSADACERWQKADDGMHQLAAAIYFTLKRADPLKPNRDVLIDAIERGPLAPGRVRETVEAFYQMKQEQNG
jgi:hypothetical protein